MAVLFWTILEAAEAQPLSAASSIDIPWLLWITSLQAALSTSISLVVGVAIAWALNRLHFPGRGLLAGLFASAIVTPGIVVAFGLLTVWGRSGWLSRVSEVWFGAPLDLPIFGLGGVVAAHVILDGAFAATILLNRLNSIPLERLKTGQSLGLSARTRFEIIDWPVIRSSLPGLGAIIFLLAFTSFPIVLLLGGGPSVQTLEVAIYSAVRLDFDLNAAVLLAVLQIGLCSAIILLAAAAPAVPVSVAQRSPLRWRDRGWATPLQGLVLLAATAGFGLPLAALLIDGLSDAVQLLESPSFWRALGTSLAIGLASAILTLVLAVTLAAARAASSLKFFRIGLGVPAYAYLAVPAVALSLGAFLFIRNLGIAPGAVAPLVVIVANTLLALPFGMATLSPAFDSVVRTRGRLMRSLGLSGSKQFMLVEWPLLGRDFGTVFALAFCFSLGDLGVIALFGTQDFVTLPLLMLRAFSAYRGTDAAAIAAVVLILAVAAFTVLPLMFERLSHARAR
ncbi:MAG: hypothetical protein ABIO40_11085 [Devosia sp.]